MGLPNLSIGQTVHARNRARTQTLTVKCRNFPRVHRTTNRAVFFSRGLAGVVCIWGTSFAPLCHLKNCFAFLFSVLFFRIPGSANGEEKNNWRSRCCGDLSTDKQKQHANLERLSLGVH